MLVDDDAWSVTIDQGGECRVVDVSQLVDRFLHPVVGRADGTGLEVTQEGRAVEMFPRSYSGAV